MTPQVISLSAAGSTAWIPVDYKQNPFNIGLSLVFSNTPNLTCKVEYTLDNVFDSSITPTAFTHTTLSSVTTNNVGSITSPIRAFRLTVTSWTSGTVTLTALQGVVNPTVYTTTPSTIDSFSYDEVFVIGGQSNADGRGVIDSSVEKASPAVLMYDKGSNIRLATEPTGVQASGWVNNIPSGISPGPPEHSFGVSLGKNVAALTGVKPMLVPCAIGSTTMVNWLPPTVAKDMTSLFGAMNARADDVLAPERSPVFCWFGHEADELQTTESLATGAISIAYLSKWDQLVNNIRAIYPDSPIIYAQLAAINSDTLRDNKRLTGEVQRQAEDNGNAGVSTAVTLNPPVGVNTNATNTVTVAGNVVTMVGDGSTGVGFTRSGMVAGTYYRVRIKAEGTGVFRINAGSIKLDMLPAGDYSVVFQADGSPPSLGIYRAASGQPTNFVFTLGTVESITGYQIANTYMVVSHDLPRNASPDDVHISTEGQKELGRRYALAYAERVLGITTIDGTGPRLVSVTSTDATHTKVKFTQTLAAAKAGETNYSDGTDSLLRVYDDGTEKAVSDVSIDGADDTALIITHASCAGVRVVTYGDRVGQDAAWRKGVIYNTLDNPLPAPMFGPVVSV